MVRGLAFEGNRALDDELLRAAISTTKSSWWASFPVISLIGLGEKRYFDEVEFRRDVVRLVLLYRASGYMNAVVDTAVVRDERNVRVTFRIYEGEPVRVTSFEIVGAEGLLDAAATKRDLPLQVGDPFNRFLLLASADTVAARLRNLGYPYAEVLRNFDSDAERRRAEIKLEVLPGARMRVGEVLLQGIEDIDSATVRKTLTVVPGAPYRQRDLFQTQRDLFAMDVFRSVNVLLVDSLPPHEPADTSVNVLVRVVEGPRHRVRIGVGYGSLDCFRTQASWSANDFLGGARVLTVSGRLSRLGVGSPTAWHPVREGVCRELKGDLANDSLLNYSAGVTLAQPAFLSPRHLATIGVVAERRREIRAYTRKAIGFNAGVTFNARRTVPVTVGWGYSVGSTLADPAVYCRDFEICQIDDQEFLRNRRRFSAVSLTAVRDRVNSPVDPTRGSALTVSLVHASRLVGSDTLYEFTRGEFEVARYYPIGRSSVFAWRLRGGTIIPQKEISLAGAEVRYVPPDQRFYAGGPNSVRGYPRNEMGPQVYFINAAGDTIPAPIGGNSLLVLNAEVRVPSPVWGQRLRLAAFCDVGRVWQRRAEVFTLDSLRITPGVGLRFATPLGPVRLDLAYRGYGREPGLLYREQPNGDLTLVGSLPATPPDSVFHRRFVLQFAVGHAF